MAPGSSQQQGPFSAWLNHLYFHVRLCTHSTGSHAHILEGKASACRGGRSVDKLHMPKADTDKRGAGKEHVCAFKKVGGGEGSE